MRTLRSAAEERKTAEKIEKLLRAGRFAEAARVAKEHERLLSYNKHFSMSEITKRMTDDDRELANLHLRKICVLSDIVEGAGIDLLELCRRYEDSLSIPLVATLTHLQRTARQITSIIDLLNDEEYSCSFGDVCDEIDRRIKNLFYKNEL